MNIESVLEKAFDWFNDNEKYNFYLYDNKGEKVGDSLQNDTLEQASAAFEKIVRRLEAGRYSLKGKKAKGDASNNTLTKFDFVLTSTASNLPLNTSKSPAMNYDELYQKAVAQAKFEIRFEQIEKTVEKLEKYLPMFDKLAKNQDLLIKALDQLTDNDEDNDEDGTSKLDEAKNTVLGLMDLFDGLKK